MLANSTRTKLTQSNNTGDMTISSVLAMFQTGTTSQKSGGERWQDGVDGHRVTFAQGNRRGRLGARMPHCCLGSLVVGHEEMCDQGWVFVVRGGRYMTRGS